jgi:hypothetical protein
MAVAKLARKRPSPLQVGRRATWAAEAPLRKHKPWCFGAEPQPPVTPLSSELAKALPSSV